MGLRPAKQRAAGRGMSADTYTSRPNSYIKRPNRAAMGATRARVIRQLLVESVLLALLGGGAGLIVATWSMSLLVKAAREIVPRLDQLHLNYRVLAFNVVVSFACGIVFGLAPACRFSKPDLQETLKDNNSGSGERQGKRLRSGLVIAEVALATILLAGAGLLIKSLVRLANSNVGFDSSNVLTKHPSGPGL